MSDTAKSSEEIEDVLSSIRRLVSDHHMAQPAVQPTAQPAHVAQDAQPAAAAAVSSGDKLVLTPALRVTDPDDPWAPVPRQEDGAAHPEEGDDWDLEDCLSDFASVGDDIDAPADDVVSRPASDPEGIAADLPPLDEMAALGADAEADADEGATIEEAGSSSAEEAVAELLGEGEAQDSADFEPEVGDTDWPGRNAERALRDLAAARGATTQPTFDDADDDLAEAGAPEGGDTPSFTPIFSRRRSEELAGHPVDPSPEDAPAWRSPVEEATPAPEEDDAAMAHGDEVEAEEVAPPSDHGHPHLRAIPQEPEDQAKFGDASDEDTVEDFGDELSPFAFPEDEAGVLDEATLREIVAEVVREELQGPLGQRITRNVRKMVRREIRLMLAADDLD